MVKNELENYKNKYSELQMQFGDNATQLREYNAAILERDQVITRTEQERNEIE